MCLAGGISGRLSKGLRLLVPPWAFGRVGTVLKTTTSSCDLYGMWIDMVYMADMAD